MIQFSTCLSAPQKLKLGPINLNNILLITNTYTLNHIQELLFPAQAGPHSLKMPDWKKWAYMDGSCQINKGKQVTGAGTY